MIRLALWNLQIYDLSMKYLFLAFAFLLIPMQAFAEEVVVATTTYCPLVCENDAEKREGVMHDVLKAAFKDTEYELRFENIPYGRAIQGTLDGRYDAVSFAGTANSPNFVFVRNFVMTNIVQFAVPKDSTWKYDGIDSVKAIRVGVPMGFRTGNVALDEYINYPDSPGRVLQASNPNPTLAQQFNIERLLTGRLDAMLCGSLAFSYIASSMGVADEIRLEPTPVVKFHNHLAFSPAHPQALKLRKLVEEKIDRMQTDGTLPAILHRYGLK